MSFHGSEPEVFTLREVAARVGPSSVRSVYNWIENYNLKVTKIAGRPMVLREDLDAFLNQFKRGGESG